MKLSRTKPIPAFIADHPTLTLPGVTKTATSNPRRGSGASLTTFNPICGYGIMLLLFVLFLMAVGQVVETW